MTHTEPAAPAACDYAAEYRAARVAVRTGDLLDRGSARLAQRIAAAAERAGVRLDEIALDEEARLIANAARPVRPEVAPPVRPFWL